MKPLLAHRQVHRQVLRGAGRAALAAAVLALAACGTSAPTRYYTLQGAARDDAGAAAQATSSAPGFALRVLPVRLPAAADSPQLLVRSTEGQILPLEGDRWLGPLGDEIRDALVAQLGRELGAPEASSVTVPADFPVYQVRLDVTRFDSVRGQYALQDINWSLRQGSGPAGEGGGAVLLCRSRQVVPPADDSTEALVGAHQQALRALGTQIAQALRAPTAQWRCP